MDATNPVALARALVRCPSITPDAGAALDLAQAALEEVGLTCHRLPFGGDGPAPADNLYARIGTTPPCFLFAGHVDVVPPGDVDRWRFPPFAGEIAEGRLWGRGAADMKSGVAAAIAATARHVAGGGAAGSIALLITGDEEGPALNGTRAVLEWAAARGERFDGCIVGEPTGREVLGDTIKIGRRGALEARLAVHGRQGHAAYPQRADNAAHRLTNALSTLIGEPLDNGTAHFEPTRLQVASIDIGNPASNIIPGSARALLNIRFNDLHTPASLERWMRERIAAHAPHHELHVSCNALPFLTEPGALSELVASAAREVTGIDPALNTLGGTSDARFVSAYCPVVELGLCGATIHQVDEHVSLDEIEWLTRIYGLVLRRFLSSA